ncbi:SpoIIE family protein phosphatase [Streptomyces stelliscabiei]|uniref:Serine phosphatase RsbU (Regulator of sigma subunit)/anti-sigma regulatory factor (Ser/Thr protein kinase) n=1 Tax=Streptomyces stelliscabiei TaxID=146820 RepID=A0A8I0PCK6_9ACTN|nr:SpoIIE family protein phosphatase [Streptomyces stelliscabiei]KND40296.1 phosphatase [Streptomyces stelliscabiei]MBE1601134.1 serine phosphatase RsbU (regulator of sigma subunit)/anti-sigma regulatory factor (Ser/Thr protein kinase) [Streptomyces stelliscabiei]MDX2517096.1 SpoIIE family protein phosphatase [Streptomyces stelliscabiei]
MDLTADGLVSRVARELVPRADELTAEVEWCLRREMPELWAHPDAMASKNVAEHVMAVLSALQYGVDPDGIEVPDAELERVRRVARHGIPVSALLRAFRLGQGIILDRLLEEMARRTDDAALISEATRSLIATATGYVDRTSEQGVVAYEEERDRRLRWRLSMVNEASVRIGTTLDIARTAQELADFATEHFADLVTVDLLRSALTAHDAPADEPPASPALHRLAQRSATHPDPAPSRRHPHTFPPGSPPARALATGQPTRHRLADGGRGPHDPHGPAEPPADGGAGEDAGEAVRDDGDDTVGDRGRGPASADGKPPGSARTVHSTLVVPLRARGATLGVAQFCRDRNPDAFDDEDLLLAQEIAARAAVAVDNARRYTHARATALTLQRSLLPRRTPRQSAVDVAFRYLPADAHGGVGGDWYDVIPLSGARVALVVGDVVGHGIHAAATMGRLRTAVRTLADIDLPPDELLTHLDDVVIRLAAEVEDDDADDGAGAGSRTGAEAGAGADAGGGGGDIGATCLYAVYDPVSRRCTLARAGHVLPALARADGTVDILDLPPGPPLGLGGLPFETAEIELPEGSLLALYTDGLVEARDHDIGAGLDRLRDALARPAASLEATCDALLEALLPARPPDDVALLLARTRRLGAGQVATWDLEAEPAAVARARAHVTRQLGDWGLAELEFTAELVVSELVTNAIRYGRPPIRLRLIRDRTLLCEVSDSGGTTPHLRRARVFDEGGRGLLLVAQLAEHWGTRRVRRGKTVWAELSDSATVPLAALAAF